VLEIGETISHRNDATQPNSERESAEGNADAVGFLVKHLFGT